jgi:Zn-dependent membrane protease YugP
MIGLFDPLFWVVVGPGVLLGIITQIWVQSAYRRARQVPALMSGAEVARVILDASGLHNVKVERVSGFLEDHYDPRGRVIRLSPEVYGTRTVAAMGIAAHEVGHALQHAEGYAPLVVRNAAVGIANLGSGAGLWLLILGIIFSIPALLWAGVILFAGTVFFQVVNLPVEFNASARAKAILAQLGVVDHRSASLVNSVLTAAALTYVAATLQAVLTLIYYLMLAQRRE